MDQPPPDASGEGASSQWPQHQVYFVTVEWHDTVHQPESPERLAQLLRQGIEHDHDHGPQMVPARFTVRVKTDAGSSEINGVAAHRHQHQHQHTPQQPPTNE